MRRRGGLRGDGHDRLKSGELVVSVAIRSTSGETDVFDTYKLDVEIIVIT
jgi:hypothetical protein